MKSARKIISVLLTAALLFAAVSVAFSVSAETEGIYTYEVSNGEAKITRCDTSASGDITIPSTLGEYPVVAIGEKAFYNCYNFTSVTIPNSVTTIESYAFYGCSNLTSVTIGNSVTTIGYRAFSSCSNLTSVAIPDSVTTIGADAFRNCKNLKNLKISNRLSSIGIHAFSYCTSLELLNIPEGITYISASMFEGCESLTNVIIPSSVIDVGDFAFYKCSNLKSITISNGVKSIGRYAFQHCINLEEITLPDSITNIGFDAFYDTAFYSDSSNLDNDGVLYIGNHLIKAKSSVISGDYSIRENTKAIAAGAFSYCSSLTSVTIPDSVTAIGSNAFLSTALYNNSSNWDKDGCLYIGNHLIAAKSSVISGDYSIREGTKTIAGSAFSSCSNLTSVTIPDGITTIGYATFENCSSLSSVTIPNGVTTIVSMAFNGCSNLESVTIGNSAITIGYFAFYYCSKLTDVYYAGTEEEWGNVKIDSYNNPLLNATIHYNSGHEHNYTPEVTTPATCTSAGLMTYTCTCGDSYTEEIPALGHTAPNEYGKCETCSTLIVAGDVDGDGVITMRDTVMINRYIVDGCKYDPNGYAVSLDETLADVNGDGKVSMLDTVMISRFVVDGGKTDPNGYNISLAPIG